MLAIFYVVLVIFSILLLYISTTQESFPVAYLGFALFLFTGLMLMNSGVELESGATLDKSISPMELVYTYDIYTINDNWIVGALANIFFYGGLVSILGTTFFALRND